MSAHRRISLAFGALYLVTFITSITALWLFQPVLDDPQGYIAGAGADNRIYLGALLELILIIANIGTAIVLIPLLKRQHEILTFSYVAARIMESVFILVGIGNGLILGYLMLRSGLMPRNLALLGVIGGPLQTLAGTAVLFDLFDAGGAV